MSAGMVELLREAEYRNPGHMLYGHAAETIVELCEALENLLSADPDMPTYQADVDAAEAALAKARGGQ